MGIKQIQREHTVLGLFLFSSSAAGKHWLVIMLDVLLIAYTKDRKKLLFHRTHFIYLARKLFYQIIEINFLNDYFKWDFLSYFVNIPWKHCTEVSWYQVPYLFEISE